MGFYQLTADFIIRSFMGYDCISIKRMSRESHVWT